MLLQVVASVSVFFIIASILTFCLKTHDSLRITVLRNVTLDVDYNNASGLVPPASNESWSAGATAWTMEEQRRDPHPAFFYIECVCNVWFTFEVIIRFVVAHNKATFVRKPVCFVCFLSLFAIFRLYALYTKHVLNNTFCISH